MVIYNAANQAKSISTGALVSALQNLTTTTEPYYVTVHSERSRRATTRTSRPARRTRS